MSEWRDRLSDEERGKVRRKALPDWTAPMLATLTKKRFSSPDWIYERKLDGERCLAFRSGRKTRLLSRNQRDLADTYPELIEALDTQVPSGTIVDGEVVAFDGDVTSFSRLQQRLGITDPEEASQSDVKVYLYLFDVLHLEGYDVTALPLRTRKALLRNCTKFADPLRFTAHRNESGEAYYAEACDKGWEGVIAKRADAAYVHHRSRDWLKFKCVDRQEFVVAGYTDPKGSRNGFGALLLGYYEGKDLVYAGKVGTGFDDELLESLAKRLQSLARKTCPFKASPRHAGSGTHWVTPKLVAEIAFTEWTGDGRLRHPRFVGLRHDKPAGKVVREEPA
ncbi:non-homologous end-joining DNA ligase [Thioalkalivibrio sp. XN279]|uniref:non-homologous end-joining DNA ligase n=1 Tax=Thioalkalivibrio sp. XN279 TaxID=2714953 RepID=UPI00140E16CA|nr:non-homologous end-joining DNA ligase [Thioalkalivibrio sp. XN279]NHA14664.1 ATP-dependent DNA ligase [Thioalkalivibrio sp. XN279]